jgi:hypothetical protein
LEYLYELMGEHDLDVYFYDSYWGGLWELISI